MARFNFTNITSQSRVDIADIMGNFNKIESDAALTSDLTSAVSTLNNTINTKETALKAVATTSANGMMSSTDKSKLDGIANNANNYSLPTASSTLGGVKTTSTVSSASGYTAVPIINGVPYYKDTNTTYNNATTSTAGLMSSTDKAKLDGIATGATKNTDVATTSANGLMSSTDKTKLDGIANNANNYSLPTAGTNALGGVKTTSTVSSNSGYTACPIISGVPYYKDTNTTYSTATTSANGLMSKTDKSKLDGIAANANNYSLPTASSTLGGVKTTSSVSDVSTYTPTPIVDGVPYYKDTDTTYNNATTNASGLMSSADKSKLDGIAANANNYTLPTASSTLGGVKTTSTVSSNSGYTACPIISGVPYYKDTNTTYSNATTSADGLMSSTDKTKLDGIATGATKNTIENVLTSDSTTNGLSAYQGKVLNTAINGKQKTITKGTAAPSGGSDGDIYIQYFT